MGMTIEEKCYLYGSCKCQTAGCVVRPDNGCPVYRYFKDLIVKDYEKRLKADLVAMLKELQLEIDEIPINADNSEPFKLGQASAYDKCENLIYQKIDTLKAESEDK